jgi:ATP-dependent protease ClpP protease subunit
MEFLIDLPKDKQTIWDNAVPILKDADGKSLTIFLTEPIGVPTEYNEACHELRHASADTTVKVILNTPGGIASSAFMIVDAMKACKAPIHGVITGEVASAGTIIAMACTSLEVADYAQLMIHNYSHGTSGSGAQVKEYVSFTDREFTKAMKTIYKGFLSPSEMKQISTQDKEIWLNKDEILKRWEKKKAAEEA